MLQLERFTSRIYCLIYRSQLFLSYGNTDLDNIISRALDIRQIFLYLFVVSIQSLSKFLLSEVWITSKLITQSLALLKNVSQLFGILLPCRHFYRYGSLSHVGQVTSLIVELGSFADEATESFDYIYVVVNPV